MKFGFGSIKYNVEKVKRSTTKGVVNFIDKIHILETSLLGPFQFKTNGDKGEGDASKNEVDFTVEAPK